MNLKKKRFIYFMLAFVVAIGVNFVKYNSLNLFVSGPWQLDLIKYEEKSRHEDWSKIIEQENDLFAKKVYSDKERLMQDMSLYSYGNLPAYLFYKVLHLRGPRLWLAQRFTMSFLGICTVLLIFLIADLFYGPLVGFVSSILMAFSPHIWITFNFDGALMRGYNLLLSLLLAYLFLLFIRRRKWYIVLLCGLVMGVNFLFFHIGSFMIPVIIFIFGIYSFFVEKKKFYYLGYFFLIVFIAVLSGFVFNYLHCLYFNLPISNSYTWFQGYFAKGPIASHTVDGIVFFDWSRLLLNIRQHIQGMFINGKTSDWHYTIAPPGIPYVYNYLISLFFVVGCFIALRYRKREDIFFFLWFSAFFVIYSLIILVRQKNIMWEIPSIFILSARSLPIVGSFLHKKIKTILEKKLVRSLCVLLVVSSLGAGSFMIFYHLPKKNFYDGGAYMGTYQIYKYLLEQGYSNQTKIMFTLPSDMIVGNMMLRLFTENVPQIICLSQWEIRGDSSLSEENINNFLEMESILIKNSDKIFYCFIYFDNLRGRIYITDEYYRNIFKKIHPDTVPFIINGLDGKPLWRIYEIKD